MACGQRGVCELESVVRMVQVWHLISVARGGSSDCVGVLYNRNNKRKKNCLFTTEKETAASLDSTMVRYPILDVKAGHILSKYLSTCSNDGSLGQQSQQLYSTVGEVTGKNKSNSTGNSSRQTKNRKKSYKLQKTQQQTYARQQQQHPQSLRTTSKSS